MDKANFEVTKQMEEEGWLFMYEADDGDLVFVRRLGGMTIVANIREER